MMRRCRRFMYSCVPVLGLTVLWSGQAIAQNKALPRAGFSTYSGVAPSNLPSAGGVFLNEGQDRQLNAPPEVYNPGEPKLGMKLARWEPRHMPLKVFVSPGLQLSQVPFEQIEATHPAEVMNMLLNDPAQFQALPRCSGYTPDMYDAVINGIEQWRPFQSEGLFAFEFVDNPTLAQIFVFWVDRFIDANGPGGSSVHGLTSATLYDRSLVRSVEQRDGRPAQGSPVVIELRVNPSTDKLRAEAAHEFGHALGIKEHSPYRQDIMYVHRHVDELSPSDKATIRWLYKQQPQYVMLPPVVSFAPGLSITASSSAPVPRQPSGDKMSSFPVPGGEVSRSSSGRYRVSPVSKGANGPDAPDGFEANPRPVAGDNSENNFQSALDQIRNSGSRSQVRTAGEQRAGKKRERAVERTSSSGTEPDSFERALDEIRGVKRKERKSETKQEQGSRQKQQDDVVDPPEKLECRPSDGY